MNNAPEKKEEPKVIHPDVILMDDVKGSESRANQKVNGSTLLPGKNPIALRFLSLIGLVCCLILLVGFLIGALILGCGAVVFLLQNKMINAMLFTYLKLIANITVTAFACLLGILSPALGIALLVIYFSLSDKNVSNEFLKHIIEKILGPR